MTELPANPIRGLLGLIALGCMTAGAWMLWGHAATLFIMGTFMAIDASVDEAIERITKTSRSSQFPSKEL
jgi:hypothetical protein